MVSYYGCLLVRPPQYTGRWDDPEHPQAMDRVVGLMGAEPVAWSYGVDCCGGSLTLNRSDVAVHLTDKLVAAAREAGADAMVTACPMCMANVDGRQLFRGGSPIPRKPRPEDKPLPIFYFTELMAMAYGRPWGKVLGKHLLDPRPLLEAAGFGVGLATKLPCPPGHNKALWITKDTKGRERHERCFSRVRQLFSKQSTKGRRIACE